MSAVPTCYYGSPGPLPARRRLRAGPLALEYEAGDLRYVRLGDREVVRRWYAAVRDPNWSTVPARLSGEHVEAGPDHFRVEYRTHHQQGEIDFAWAGSITGTAEGTIAFHMDGVARSTFRRNRIGFCLLHPARECAGARCRFELGDGTSGEGTFPRFIAPRNPFHDLRTLAHEVAPGVWAELRFEGDLFEMEDQRNWTDASFKTFCTPLRLPFPVVVTEGTRVRQTVTLRLLGPVPAVRTGEPPATLAIGPTRLGALPQLGLGVADHGQPLTAREAERLRLLRPAHLRVELDLTNERHAEHALQAAAADATLLGAGLEAALTVSDAAWEQTAALVQMLHAFGPPLRRVLLFHDRTWATPEHVLRPAVEALARYDASVSVYAGTTANFAELNRGRPPIDRVDGVCYSAHPQEHAYDNSSLVECCAALGDTLRSARQFCGDLPIAVTPVTLRKRVNPYATGPALPALPGELPPTVDPRQTSLFGAGWTLASLKYLAESGVDSVTYYETIGWRGVMECAHGCPLPSQFPSQPGMVFPLFHVLADAAEFAGADVLPSVSSHPLAFDGLTLRKNGTLRVMLANLTEHPRSILIRGLPAEALVRTLEEGSYERATMTDPIAFHEVPGEPWLTRDGTLQIRLQPYSYGRIDCT
jgi:hypothetical protein